MITTFYTPTLNQGSVVGFETVSTVTSEAFEAAALATTTHPKAYLQFIFSDNSTLILDSSEIKSFKYTRSAGASNQLSIGSCVSSTFTAEILSDSGLFTNQLHNAIVIPYCGYVVNNVEALVKGVSYYIDGSETEFKGLFSEIKAYDKMSSSYFNTALGDIPNYYVSSGFDAGLSPRANAVIWNTDYFTSAQINATSLPNSSGCHVLLDNDLTIRDALSRFGAMSGMSALMDSDNLVKYVKPSNEPVIELDSGDYFPNNLSIDFNHATSIYGITAELEQEGENNTDKRTVTKTIGNINGGTLISLDSTFFSWVDEGQESLGLNEMFSRTFPYDGNEQVPIEYTPFSLTLVGLPQLEPFDKISVNDSVMWSQQEWEFIPVTVELTYNGGLKTKLEASAFNSEKSTVTNYSSQVEVLHSEALSAKAFFEYLAANRINAQTLVAQNAYLGNIEAESGTIHTLESDYMKTDAANITEAGIENLFAETGLITDLTVNDLKVIGGELNAITINGDYITAGTITADRLLVRDEYMNYSPPNDITYYAYPNASNTGFEYAYTVQDGTTIPLYRGYDGSTVYYYYFDENNERVPVDDPNELTIVSISDANFQYLSQSVKSIVGILNSAAFVNDNVEAQSPVANGYQINGKVLQAKTINADKIQVDDLSACAARIGGFDIGSNNLKYNQVVINGENISGSGIYFDNTGRAFIGTTTGTPTYILVNPVTSELTLRATSVGATKDLKIARFIWNTRDVDDPGSGATKYHLSFKWEG